MTTGYLANTRGPPILTGRHGHADRHWCRVVTSQSVTLAFSLAVYEVESQYWGSGGGRRGCYPFCFVKSYLVHLSHS